MRGTRQHAVFARDPAAAGIAHPRGYALFDAGRAQHTCVAKLGEHTAFGVHGVIGNKA